MKETFKNSIKLAYQKKKKQLITYFSTSNSCQNNRAKKDCDETLLKTWTPFSLLYVNLKIISIAFASRYKTVLLSIISLEETAYIERRFIFEGGWLISDILSVTNNM